MSDKLEIIARDIAEIKTDVSIMKVDMAHHIKRTDELEAQMEPLRNSYIEFKGLLKFLGILAAICSIAEVVIRLR